MSQWYSFACRWKHKMVRSAGLKVFLVLLLVFEIFSLSFAGETLYYVGTAPPSLNVNPSSLAFGIISGGSSATLSITIRNKGAGDLVIASVSSPSSPYITSGDTCSGQTLAQSSTCTISITFTPMFPGVFSSSFTIASNDPAEPNFTVTVIGSANGVIISATPGVMEFGSVSLGNSTNQVLTLQNVGNSNLTITSITSPSAPFSETAGTCVDGITLAPTQSCTLTFTFTPPSEDTWSDTLTVISDARNAAVLTVTVKGTSTAPPQISIAPNPVNFGTRVVGSTSSSTTIVRNTGSGNLVLGNPSLGSLASPLSIASTTCSVGLSLPATATCIINTAFTPISVGSFNRSFTVCLESRL